LPSEAPVKFIVSILVLAASSLAFAETVQPVKPLVLTRVTVDGVETPKAGVLSFDSVNEEIRLDIYSDMCGQFQPPSPGMFKCMIAATLEQSLVVPVKSTEFDCGSVIKAGSKDLRNVDGALVTIKVTDNSTRTCANMISSVVVVEAATEYRGKTVKYLLLK
jgi:hypothetical protein